MQLRIEKRTPPPPSTWCNHRWGVNMYKNICLTSPTTEHTAGHLVFQAIHVDQKRGAGNTTTNHTEQCNWWSWPEPKFCYVIFWIVYMQISVKALKVDRHQCPFYATVTTKDKNWGKLLCRQTAAPHFVARRGSKIQLSRLYDKLDSSSHPCI